MHSADLALRLCSSSTRLSRTASASFLASEARHTCESFPELPLVKYHGCCFSEGGWCMLWMPCVAQKVASKSPICYARETSKLPGTQVWVVPLSTYIIIYIYILLAFSVHRIHLRWN